MLKHICFANEKMKADKHRMISIKSGKAHFFPEYPLFFAVYTEKYLKSASAAEGGVRSIQFSAEIMVNRATWRIVEYIRFVHSKNRTFVAPRGFLWIFV